MVPLRERKQKPGILAQTLGPEWQSGKSPTQRGLVEEGVATKSRKMQLMVDKPKNLCKTLVHQLAVVFCALSLLIA